MKHVLRGLIAALLVGLLHFGFHYWQRTRERARIEQENQEMVQRWRDGERENVPFREATRRFLQEMEETPVPLPADPIPWSDRLFVALLAGIGVAVVSLARSERREPDIARHF